MNKEQITSIVEQRKKSFAELVRAFLILNVSNLTSVAVTATNGLNINGVDYKLDVDDYTGTDGEPYVFYNTSSGRIVIERNGKRVVYKLEVELMDY